MRQRLSVADIQDLIGQSRFHQLLRPTVLDVRHDPSELIIKFTMSELVERQPRTNQWHGGAISAVVDTAGCYAFLLHGTELPPTINMRVDYLRVAENTDVTAIAKVRRAGRVIGVADVEIADDNGHVVALGRATYALRAEAPSV